MKKWAKKGGYENFGQKELRALKSKFKENPYGSPQERQISQMLSAFNDWAINYSGDMRESINEDGHTDVPSAIRKLKTATEDAVQILQALEGRPDEELPSWWMSKLTLASDYLNKARDYLLVPSETMEE